MVEENYSLWRKNKFFNNYGNVEPQKSTTPYESRSPITHSPSPVHPDWGTPVLPAIRSSDPLIAPDRQVQGLNPVTPHLVTVSLQNVPDPCVYHTLLT